MGRDRLTWQRAAPLIGLAGAAGAAFLLLGDRLSFETLRENRAALVGFRDAWPLATAGLYWAAYVAMVALSLPGGVWMTLAGGFLFGAVVATALTVTAATAGATLLFLAVRAGLGAALHARIAAHGGFVSRLERGLRANEVSVLLLMRLVPAVPFFVANLAPAFLGVRLPVYVLTTLFGIIPGTAVFAWAGSGLGAVLEAGGEPDLGLFLSWPVLGPILGLCALSALPILLRAVRGRAA